MPACPVPQGSAVVAGLDLDRGRGFVILLNADITACLAA
jgi:hypothetical protein